MVHVIMSYKSLMRLKTWPLHSHLLLLHLEDLGIVIRICCNLNSWRAVIALSKMTRKHGVSRNRMIGRLLWRYHAFMQLMLLEPKPLPALLQYWIPMRVYKVAAAVLADWLQYSKTTVDLHALDWLASYWCLGCIQLIASFLMKCLIPQRSLGHLTLTLGRCLQRSYPLVTSDRVTNN
jgi:hypothetical protein